MTRRFQGKGIAQAWRGGSGRLSGPPAARTPVPFADAAPLLRSQIVKKILPQQNGALRLSARFADRLGCVRYRTDPESGRRFTTVEILFWSKSIPGPHPSAIPPRPPAHSHRLGRGRTARGHQGAGRHPGTRLEAPEGAIGSRSAPETGKTGRIGKCLDMETRRLPDIATNVHIWKFVSNNGNVFLKSTLR